MKLLAVVWALLKFCFYVMGEKIIITTDYKAVIFLKTCKLLSGRLTRCIMTIQDYHFQTKYPQGKKNVVADTSSCLPGQDNGLKLSYKNAKIILYALAKKPSSTLREQLQNSGEEQKPRSCLETKETRRSK